MLDFIKTVLSRIDADYADIRYEKKKETVVSFDGKELSQAGANSTDGFVVRVLKNGGFASGVFTRREDAEKAIASVIENAQLIGRNLAEPVKLAEVEVAKEVFKPQLKEDPRQVSFEEKIEITRKANLVPLASPEIVTTKTAYNEIIREKYFVTSAGTEIQEDLITVSLGSRITAKDGNLIQEVIASSGGSDGFHSVRNQEKNFADRTRIAIDLLQAKPVTGGVYNCILNPSMAGVFTHEAFGHSSEADCVESCPAMLEKMQIGARLGSGVLSITDDATMPGLVGFYRYDDEGVRVRRTELLKNGVLAGRLHSRRTAASFGEPISGHTVAEDFRYPPIIRMGNIFIEPGESTVEELFARLDDGLYILDAKGGQTSGDNFTFGAQYGYIVKNGKKAGMIRDINISGNLFQTMMNISAVANDLEFVKRGGCGKGQMNFRSCKGSPHVLALKLVVGGR
ncbi:MAG: TldD/PmbA family protein [Candidatus Rifleibacteriota bacterium]